MVKTKNTFKSGVITFLRFMMALLVRMFLILFTMQTGQNTVPNLKSRIKDTQSLHSKDSSSKQKEVTFRPRLTSIPPNEHNLRVVVADCNQGLLHKQKVCRSIATKRRISMASFI